MKEKQIEVHLGKILGWAVFGLLALMIVFGSFYTIDAGERGVLLTFGKAQSVSVQPGLHFKIPIAQSVQKMDVRTAKYESEADSSSKDLQIVTTSIAVNYHLDPSKVSEVYSNIGKDYEDRIVQPAIQESIKSVMAKYTAEELVTKRPVVKKDIVESIKDRLGQSSLVVDDILITNFNFSQSFDNAIEAKVTAEQQALKAKNDLVRIKIEKEQQIIKAEANAREKELKADAEAYSLRVIREEIEKNEKLIQYNAVDKWNGALPKYVASNDSESSTFLDITGMIEWVIVRLLWE